MLLCLSPSTRVGTRSHPPFSASVPYLLVWLFTFWSHSESMRAVPYAAEKFVSPNVPVTSPLKIPPTMLRPVPGGIVAILIWTSLKTATAIEDLGKGRGGTCIGILQSLLVRSLPSPRTKNKVRCSRERRSRQTTNSSSGMSWTGHQWIARSSSLVCTCDFRGHRSSTSWTIFGPWSFPFRTRPNSPGGNVTWIARCPSVGTTERQCRLRRKEGGMEGAAGLRSHQPDAHLVKFLPWQTVRNREPGLSGYNP